MKCPECQTDNPPDSKFCKECAAPLPSSKEIPVTETLETPREEYEKIISYPTASRDFGDIYDKSFYMLGQIYEQQGKKTIAIENYEKFLDLWKDADPGMAEVEDAKKRLAKLQVMQVQIPASSR